MFGPIRNWSNGESKILLEFDREEVVKKRRQFVLEDVASWYKVGDFGKEGADALRNAHRRSQILKMNADVDGAWDKDISQIEQEAREEEEVVKVVNEESAKRAIEILNMGITIQDLASSEDTNWLDMLHLTKEGEDKTLERVIIRIKDENTALVKGGEFTSDLTTLRSKAKRKKKLEGTLAQQLAKL